MPEGAYPVRVVGTGEIVGYAFTDRTPDMPNRFEW